MGFLAKLHNKRVAPAGNRLEQRIRELYAKHGTDVDASYGELYGELSGTIELDIATVITLIQIAILIWQWYQKLHVSQQDALTVPLPEFDFTSEHEAALSCYGAKLGLC